MTLNATCLSCSFPLSTSQVDQVRVQIGYGGGWMCASCVDGATHALALWRKQREVERQEAEERHRLERIHAPLTHDQTVMVRRALTRLAPKYHKPFLEMMHEETRGHEVVDDDFVRSAIEILVSDLIRNGPFVMETV